MYGTKETKEALGFVFALYMAIDKAKKNDGKISLSDAPLFMGAVMKALPAFDKINEVGREIKDLDEAEKAELKAFIKSEFSIEDDAVLESKIEEGLILIKQIAHFVLNV